MVVLLFVEIAGFEKDFSFRKILLDCSVESVGGFGFKLLIKIGIAAESLEMGGGFGTSGKSRLESEFDRRFVGCSD